LRFSKGAIAGYPDGIISGMQRASGLIHIRFYEEEIKEFPD
jgi:hypothetical protein